MALLGSARFAWQSDYGQFYLVDPSDDDFRAPTDITPEIERSGFAVPAAGLVVYTQDSLQQQVRIHVHDKEPAHAAAEPMSGRPWTRTGAALLHFPSRRFSLTSPSSPHPLPAGPVFLLGAAAMAARIGWMEFQGSRDDSVPVEPDVIEVTLWPAAAGRP